MHEYWCFQCGLQSVEAITQTAERVYMVITKKRSRALTNDYWDIDFLHLLKMPQGSKKSIICRNPGRKACCSCNLWATRRTDECVVSADLLYIFPEQMHWNCNRLDDDITPLDGCKPLDSAEKYLTFLQKYCNAKQCNICKTVWGKHFNPSIILKCCLNKKAQQHTESPETDHLFDSLQPFFLIWLPLYWVPTCNGITLASHFLY